MSLPYLRSCQKSSSLNNIRAFQLGASILVVVRIKISNICMMFPVLIYFIAAIWNVVCHLHPAVMRLLNMLKVSMS